jgi:hypothetical protein
MGAMLSQLTTDDLVASAERKSPVEQTGDALVHIIIDENVAVAFVKLPSGHVGAVDEQTRATDAEAETILNWLVVQFGGVFLQSRAVEGVASANLNNPFEQFISIGVQTTNELLDDGTLK